MPTVQDVTRYLEQIAPRHYQESYDNAGLITGRPGWEVTGVLTCLDSTEAVIDEAVEKGCNLVVAHHPIVFRGLKSLTGSNYVERTIISALKQDVAIYAIHTNLDNVFRNGVNERIGQALGLVNTSLLAPKNTDEEEREIGSGLIGELPQPMGETNFLQFLKQRMQAGCIRHTALRNREVRRVAVCGGAGGFLLQQAIAANADFFVTADYKYHEFFDAEGRLVIADIGHFESEQYTIDLLQELITEKFPTFAVRSTRVKTNPVHYF